MTKTLGPLIKPRKRRTNSLLVRASFQKKACTRETNDVFSKSPVKYRFPLSINTGPRKPKMKGNKLNKSSL